MNFVFYLDIYIAPLGGLLIILLDYYRNKSVDTYQRNLFLMSIIFTILTISMELAYYGMQGEPGAHAHNVIYAFNFLYFVFQLLAYSFLVLFLDYLYKRDHKRISKLSKMLIVISAVNFVLLLINTSGPAKGFYFDVNDQNIYVLGKELFIRLMVTYTPLVIAIFDLIMCRKNLSRYQLTIFALFALPNVVGSLLDFSIAGATFMWPSFCVSLLFVYLFIIRADYRIDTLTGVDNRRSCDEYLSNLSRQSRGASCGIVLIDLDEFKAINDTFGHAEGDIALRDAAAIIKSSVRHSDFVARYGGDEFLIVLKSDEVTELVIGRIEKNLVEFNEKGHRPFKLGFSIGYDTYYPFDGLSAQEFLKHVDTLMYNVKRERRAEAL